MLIARGISSLRILHPRRHLHYPGRCLSLTATSQFIVKSKPGTKTSGHELTTPAASPMSPTVDPVQIQPPVAPQSVQPEAPPPPPKKSMKEQIIIFYSNMWRDYREVFKDAYTEGKQKPWKTVLYSAIFGAMGYLLWTNPTEADFDEECFQNRTKLALVGIPIRNPASVEHCTTIEKLRLKGQLRYQSLGFFSVVWRHDNSPEVGAISATCTYLKPRLREFNERLIDIGFGNRWWIGIEKMKNYDVNEREWEIADLLKAQRILEQQQQQQQQNQETA